MTLLEQGNENQVEKTQKPLSPTIDPIFTLISLPPRYLERRENFKKVLQYGESKVPKKKIGREGFVEIAL